MPDRTQLPARPRKIVTAAAQRLDDYPAATARSLFQYDSWQEEAWSYWRNLGELNNGISWLANSMSRVRLTVAEVMPGGDEPAILEEGPAVDLMSAFAGGTTGQTMIMAAFGYQLGVPGEGWLVVERDDESVPLELATWRFMPTTSVRHQRGYTEIRIGENRWRKLAEEGFATKIFREDPQFPWKAFSAVQAALPILRRIDLVDRRIVAVMVSRLAMNGLLIIPQEGTFKVPERFKNAASPFYEMLLEAAAMNIKMPGSASAAIPLLIEYAAEFIDKWKLLTWSDVLPAELLDEREREIKRLATTMSMPTEALTGMGEVSHWCTTPDVEIMTGNGWRTYDQLTPGEVVLTLNHQTGLSQWQPLLALNTWDVVDEPMTHIKGRRHSSVTTAQHRWPTLSGRPHKRGRDWITSAELARAANADGPDRQRQEYLVLAAPNADVPAEAKYSDALVELVAWYYTEGNKGIRPGRRTPKIAINQSATVNPGHCARIERALTALFGSVSEKLDKGGRYASPESIARNAEAKRLRADYPQMTIREIGRRIGVSPTTASRYLAREPRLRDSVPRWRLQRSPGRDLNRYILNAAAAEVLLAHAPGRVVRLDFVRELTTAQLELFIDVSIKGDGNYMMGKTPVFSQKDPAMCDAFELAAILSGRSINRQPRTGIGISANGPREKTQDVVVLSDRNTFAPRGRSFTEHLYTGTIWCPTTLNGTWLARHEGTVFFTGNSGWQLEETGIKIWVAPPVEIVCDGLTTGYLYPLLDQMGEKPVGPNGGRIVVWYDTSELSARPDKSKQATEAYDRMEISGTAYRREIGMDEADMPDNTELADQILKFAARQPQTVSQALKALTGKAIEAPASGTPSTALDQGAGLPAQPEQSGAQQRTMPQTQGEPPPPPNGAARVFVDAVVAGAPIRPPGSRPSPKPRAYNGVR